MGIELVPPRPTALEAWDQQVDEAFGLAKLPRRHPVELAVAEHFALRVGIGRDDDALDRRFVSAFVVVRGHRRPVLVGRHLPAFLTGFGRCRARGVLLLAGLVLARQRR